MSRVPALPNLFAPRELTRSPVPLVIARMGIRESFAVVRTRLPLALVLWIMVVYPFSPLSAPSPPRRLYVPTLPSASRGKAQRKWLFHQAIPA